MTKRLPEWLKRPISREGESLLLKTSLGSSSLKTVCEEAKCPNIGECWCSGTATFLVLGDQCSRSCRFCSVKKGGMFPPESDEKIRLYETVKSMGIEYVVITMVTRDDLPDGGSAHIAEMVRYLKNQDEDISVEVLVSDFDGNLDSVQEVLDSGIDVFGHNVEMVRALYSTNRPRADYDQSLSILRYASKQGSVPVKTSLMVGLGESQDELCETIKDIAEVGTDILTIGQYLQPTVRETTVKRYITPQEFEFYKQFGKDNGILHVESAPYVRSSYRASDILNKYKNAGTPA